MEIVLRVTAGPHAGREYRFDGHDSFLVGRASFAHFRLPQKDPFFSRLHFLIEINPPRCKLVDMGSTNGTKVNGSKVDTVELRDGDKIEGGKTTLEVVIPREEESESSRAASVSERSADSDRAASVSERDGADAASSIAPVVKLAVRPQTPDPRFSDSDAVRAVGAPVIPPPLPPIPPPPPARGQWLAAPTTVAQPVVPLAEFPSDPALPAIPGYRLLETIGQGGMGVVYQAVRLDDPAGEIAALKTIRPAGAASQRAVQRFLREAEILKQLRHPNVVRFRDSGQAGDLMYFVMDYVPGVDCERLVRVEGPLPVGRATALVAQVLDALQFAHDHGYVHRDVKPSNLLVTAPERIELHSVPQADGTEWRSATQRRVAGVPWVAGVESSSPRPVSRRNRAGGDPLAELADRPQPPDFVSDELCLLADFGLARVYQQSQLSGLTMLGETGGTVAFMPPEQVTNFRNAEPPADQYSAAATLYYLLTGHTPHDLTGLKNHQALKKILLDEPTPIRTHRRDLARPLADALHRALSRDPARRFPDAASFARAIT